jgi:hypothetical protein
MFRRNAQLHVFFFGMKVVEFYKEVEHAAASDSEAPAFTTPILPAAQPRQSWRTPCF